MSVTTVRAIAPADTALARLFAHDLRTPLGPLMLAVSALAEDGNLDDDVRDLARMAMAQGDRLKRLFDATLRALEPPTIRTGPVDLGNVVRDAARSVEEMGGACTMQVPSSLWVRGDEVAIRDALIGVIEVVGADHARTTVVIREGVGRVVVSVRGATPASEPASGTPASGPAALIHGARAVFEACGGGLELGEEAVVWLPTA